MLHLILVIHNHQPLGNLPDVFRKAYDIAYGPFINVIAKHPAIKWGLHTSGCLWEWLESNEPGYLDFLRDSHREGRLEFLTGGMWEPIQPVISEDACLLQFDLMRKYLCGKFGVDPVGSWTTERVWEPSHAGRLCKAGIKYTLLDDSQFRAALPGPKEHQVWGYYRTEHQGKSVAVFPINEMLRYLIPFRKADEVVAYLEELAGILPDGAAITYGDDGEKFGLWPETNKWVYEQGWLDEFLGRVERSKVITTTHPSEYMRIMPHPRQRVYLPASSYREMGIWTLYPHRNLAAEKIYEMVQADRNLKSTEPPHVAGFFRGFFSRYPESCLMHERASEIIAKIIAHEPDVKPSLDKNASPMSRGLWHALRAQCNCSYWHGVFGGLYLNYLRFAVNREILKAEDELAKVNFRAGNPIRISTTHSVHIGANYEADSESSLLIPRPEVHWVIDPSTGQIISAGSVEKKVDVIDVLARRFEAYHATMREAGPNDTAGTPASIHNISEVAPVGWNQGFGYDKTRRGCFCDRVIATRPSLDSLASVQYSEEVGPDSGFWNVELLPGEVVLSNVSGIWTRHKKLNFSDEGREAAMEYNIGRTDNSSFSGFIILEFNIGLLAGDAPDRYHLLPDGKKIRLGQKYEIEGGKSAVCVDEWTGARIEMEVPDAEWAGAYPVRTLSRGEAGLEMNYQGTCVLFRIPLNITPGSKAFITSAMRVM